MIDAETHIGPLCICVVPELVGIGISDDIQEGAFDAIEREPHFFELRRCAGRQAIHIDHEQFARYEVGEDVFPLKRRNLTALVYETRC